MCISFLNRVWPPSLWTIFKRTALLVWDGFPLGFQDALCWLPNSTPQSSPKSILGQTPPLVMIKERPLSSQCYSSTTTLNRIRALIVYNQLLDWEVCASLQAAAWILSAIWSTIAPTTFALSARISLARPQGLAQHQEALILSEHTRISHSHSKEAMT